MKSKFRLIKRIAKTMVGNDFFTTVDCHTETVSLGVEYGGWTVAADSFNNNSIIYSFGVGEDISFDLDLMRAYDVTVHAFDPTPKSIQWIRSQQLPESFILHEYGLADFDGEISFNPPENLDHVSHTILKRTETEAYAIRVPVRRLRTIMQQLGHAHIDLIKMDIEGAEYQVIDDLIASQVHPMQLLIEFHHRFPNVGIQMTKDSIKKLRVYGYQLFSVSDNGEEYGFILNDSV